MRLSSGYEQRRARIEMIPLIDCVFLLLTFFIYAALTMVVHRGLRIELPSAATAQSDRQEYVSVTVTRDNAIYVGDERVSLGELVEAVRREARFSPHRRDVPVFISGDARADLGVVIEALDLLRGAGVKEVSFECKEEIR